MSEHIQIEPPIEIVFLWGMMGVGKSVFGKKLAHHLDWTHVDLDAFIEQEQQRSISEIFAEEGEAGFRAIERKMLKRIVKSKGRKVVSLGGGTPAKENNAEWMTSKGLCVWMDAPVGMLVHRLMHAQQERPLLAGLDEAGLRRKIEDLMEERTPFYKQAHMILSVNNLAPKEAIAIVQQIIQDKS